MRLTHRASQHQPDVALQGVEAVTRTKHLQVHSRSSKPACEAVRRIGAPTTGAAKHHVRMAAHRLPHSLWGVLCNHTTSRRRCLYFGVERAQGHCSLHADLMHVGRLGNLGPRALSSQPQLPRPTHKRPWAPFHRRMRIIVKSCPARVAACPARCCRCSAPRRPSSYVYATRQCHRMCRHVV
jgi:hypothetical protein